MFICALPGKTYQFVQDMLSLEWQAWTDLEIPVTKTRWFGGIFCHINIARQKQGLKWTEYFVPLSKLKHICTGVIITYKKIIIYWGAMVTVQHFDTCIYRSLPLLAVHTSWTITVKQREVRLIIEDTLPPVPEVSPSLCWSPHIAA